MLFCYVSLDQNNVHNIDWWPLGPQEDKNGRTKGQIVTVVLQWISLVSILDISKRKLRSIRHFLCLIELISSGLSIFMLCIHACFNFLIANLISYRFRKYPQLLLEILRRLLGCMNVGVSAPTTETMWLMGSLDTTCIEDC